MSDPVAPPDPSAAPAAAQPAASGLFGLAGAVAGQALVSRYVLGRGFDLLADVGTPVAFYAGSVSGAMLYSSVYGPDSGLGGGYVWAMASGGFTAWYARNFLAGPTSLTEFAAIFAGMVAGTYVAASVFQQQQQGQQ